MAHLNISGFGQELDKYEYKNVLDWFIRFNNVNDLWKAQPTFLLAQACLLMGALSTLTHAMIKGGRWPWLWWTAFLHGTVVESLSYVMPDADGFWHSQTPVIFLGGRFPPHILFMYPVFIYHATYAISKLQLPKWAEPLAVGLVVILITLPFEIVGVKFLHWIWHDTDPNLKDRHYYVPWNSYYFHMTFTASLTFWFQKIPKIFKTSKEQWESSGDHIDEMDNSEIIHIGPYRSQYNAFPLEESTLRDARTAGPRHDSTFFKEFLICIISALLGGPGGILLFLPVYHPLHDFGKIHSEVTFFILFAVFLTIAWTGDRTARKTIYQKISSYDYLLLAHLVIHYSLYLGMCIWGSPENEVSIGLHEPIGPCENRVPVTTAFGSVLEKREFLCVTDNDQDYFDFHCLPGGKPPKHGTIWYTACGVPFENRIEYITIISISCLMAVIIFYNFYFNSPVGCRRPEKDQASLSKQKKVQ